MKKATATTFCFSLLLTVVSFIEAAGCLLSVEPVKKFNAAEYLFIGEVAGYTKLYEKELPKPAARAGAEVKEIYKEWGAPTKAVGLIVKVSESIFTPQMRDGFFEVIPYALMSDCSFQGRYSSEEKIARDFAVGSKVRVIAVESFIFPNSSNQGDLRLDVTSSSGLVPDDALTNADAELAYKKIASLDTEKIQNLLAFELRKDLFRLEFGHSFAEKRRTLERLVFFPKAWKIDYEAIIRNYTTDEDAELRENLNKLRKEFLEKQKN
ncbi:MAG TPA: hypothetical protein VF599_09565 [Pyrinomonadaceae bacterium]|jgi:hypothetical protein